MKEVLCPYCGANDVAPMDEKKNSETDEMFCFSCYQNFGRNNPPEKAHTMMSIRKEFERIFRGEQAMSRDERELLKDTMLCMLDDRELGLAADVLMVWACKITGVIEFMAACGKIDESQEEDLRMIINAIEARTCTK